MPADALLKTSLVPKTVPRRFKTSTIKAVKVDRPGWIPPHITENWDTDPFAYQTEEELMPAGGLHGQLLTYVTEVVRAPLEKQGLMLLVDTFLLYRDPNRKKQRVAPDLLLMPHQFPAPSAYDLDLLPPPRCLVETTSPRSRFKDLEGNVPFYFGLGVETYFVIDAITPQKTLRSPIKLHLWRKTPGQPYQEVPPDGAGYFLLPEIKLKIAAQQQRLIFADAVTGEVLRDGGQLSDALKEAEQRANVEAQRAKMAEQRAKTAYEEGERNKALEIARNMLAKGLDATFIAQITDLSFDEIAALH
jgi:hypothetical protein